MKNSHLYRLLPILLAVSALSGSVAVSAPNQALAGKKLLYVGASTDSAKAKDEIMQNYLTSLGFKVTFIDQGEPASRADGQDIVLVSPTVSSVIVGGKFKETPAAVVLFEAFLLDDMGMSGLQQGVDYGEEKKNAPIWLVNFPLPMQAGLSNGLMAAHKGKTAALQWGRPTGGATVIATIAGEPDKAVYYGYEKGAMMGGNIPAPGRRLFLFAEEFDELNPNSLKLVESSLVWAANAH